MSSLAPPRSSASSVGSTVDPTAKISALFDAHCGFVCRSLRHLGVDDDALDDAVQDVFVTAYRRLSSFEGRSAARSWLYGIARRIAFRYRRAAHTRARHRGLPARDDPAAWEGIDEPFERVHAADSLAVLLDRLDPPKRSVFLLHEVEGLTAVEIAAALGVPEGTVYSRLRAAWRGLGNQAEHERRRLQRALPDLRAAAAPSVERRRRMWGMVAGGLGGLPDPATGIARPGIGATAGASGRSGIWLGQVKWVVVGAALGAGLLGARAAVVASRDGSDRPPVARTEVSPARGSMAAAAPDASSETSETMPDQPSAADAVPRSPAARPAPARPTPTAGPSPSPRAGASAAAAPSRSPSPPPAPSSSTAGRTTPAPADDPLTAEMRLIRDAQREIRAGRGDAALALLDAHARRFPEGQLAAEARTARIAALCSAGRNAEATALARRLGRDPDTACPPR